MPGWVGGATKQFETSRRTSGFLGPIQDFGCRSEGLLAAHSVEKHLFAGAEFRHLIWARAPFLSGFSRLLRCGEDLGQFAEVLRGGGEEEFVIRPAWTT